MKEKNLKLNSMGANLSNANMRTEQITNQKAQATTLNTQSTVSNTQSTDLKNSIKDMNQVNINCNTSIKL
jgi:hypothetical protein